MSTPRFLDLPNGVRRTAIETARGTFAALEAPAGSGGGALSRHTALLVPGFTGSKEDFAAVLAPLARAGHRVVSIDMRGQYETPGPDDPAAYTVEALGEDIAAVLEALGPAPVHLLGHSFGGLVTREAVIAGRRPAASFTLMGSGPAAIGGSRATDGWALLDTLPKIGIEQVWAAHMEPDAVANGVPPEVVAFLRRRMLGNSVSGLLGMVYEVLTCADRVDNLAKAALDGDLPILVLYGHDDNGWEPAEQAAMAARLGAEHVVIPGAAHSPAWEAPEATAQALRTFWGDAER